MYKKISNQASGPEDQIVFYFLHKTLFENVQHQSAFMCKNIVSKDGEDLSERFSITDDEEPMFKLCLAESIPNIYDTIKPLTYNISDAFTKEMSDNDLTDLIGSHSSDGAGPWVVFRIMDNGAYNPNTLELVDSALRSSIEQGVLAEFYTRVTHSDLTKLSATMFTGQLRALGQRILALRKKTVFP